VYRYSWLEVPSSLDAPENVYIYRGTSLIRNSLSLGPYSRTVPRALWWSEGGGRFLMSEVPLYRWLEVQAVADLQEVEVLPPSA